MNKARGTESGFTLIELLVVVAIIGILAAIAIPQFAAYKIRSFNARAESDLRNVITGQEAYFVDHEDYTTCDESSCPTSLPGIATMSAGVKIWMEGGWNVAINGYDFRGAACHTSGNTMYGFSPSNPAHEGSIFAYSTFSDPSGCEPFSAVAGI